MRRYSYPTKELMLPYQSSLVLQKALEARSDRESIPKKFFLAVEADCPS
jgi:hypothetical protein